MDFEKETFLTVKAHLELEMFVQNYIETSEEDKLKIIHSIYDEYGISTKNLPQFTKNVKKIYPAKDLLAKDKNKLRVSTFNELMISDNLMKEETVTNNQGEKIKFNVLINEGLKYGQNTFDTKNMEKSQPYYFEDTFPELLSIVNPFDDSDDDDE